MTPEELAYAVAMGIRKRQIERTTSGRAFDESIPPTDTELDNARAAIRIVAEAAAGVVDDWSKKTFPAPEPEAQSIIAAIRALIPEQTK